MPEAVIVAAARSPIGRAFKGSLADDPARRSHRADDPGRAGQGARARPRRHRRPDARLRPARRRAGLQHGPGRRGAARLRPRCPAPPITRYCSSSLQTTRMAMHAIKAGEGDVFISAGVETVSRFVKGNSDSLPDTQNPLFADAEARSAARRRGRRRQRGTTRARTATLPDVYIAMGQTAENLALAKGVTREDMDHFGVRSQNLAEKAIANGFFAREITPVTLPDGTVVATDDGPRAGVTYDGGRAAQAGVPPRRPGHRRQLLPAQRRRRRPGDHERHQGRRAGPHPAGPDRLHRRHRALAGDHGPRPGRGVEAGARQRPA